MKNFFAVLIVSILLMVLCINLFQGLAVILIPAAIIAGAVALYMDMDKRIKAIEVHLGLRTEEETEEPSPLMKSIEARQKTEEAQEE